MKKKILSLLMILTLVFACAFVLSACDNDKETENKISEALTSFVTQSDAQSQTQSGDTSAELPHKHNYIFVEFVWAEDFTAQAKFVCDNDNETEYCAATVTNEVTTEPLCKTEGVRTYTAAYKDYSDTKTEVIPALGHDRVNHVAKSATCTEIGWEAYETCTRCDYTTYVEISATGHNYVDGVCTICGKEKETIVLQYTLNSGEKNYSVTGIGTATATDIVIPDIYEGKPVTSIGPNAFLGCRGLTSVTIPDSVTSIGQYAFLECPIESATIPAFACPYIKNDKLKKITITSGESIASSAFNGCSSLTSVTISNGVTSIGGSAFRNCSSLTSVIIPDSVTSIGSWAFYGCSNLTSVTIPDSVTSIGDHAFCGCSSLTSVTIPNSVKSIGSYAFYECSSLTSVIIPDSVTSIGEYAFLGCSSLTSVIIPNSVTSIASSAFLGCSSLTSVTIGNSVTSIGDRAFYNCSSLTSVNFNGTKVVWQAISKGSDWKYKVPATEVVCTDGEVSL